METKKLKTDEQITIVFDNTNRFHVYPNALMISDVMKHFAESYLEDPENNQEIHIGNNNLRVKMEYVSKVFEFLQLHYDDPIEEIKLQDSLRDCIKCKYPDTYLRIIGENIYNIREFLIAADWLGIPILIRLLLCVLKFLIRSKTREEMIAILEPKFPVKYTLNEVIDKIPFLVNKE